MRYPNLKDFRDATDDVLRVGQPTTGPYVLIVGAEGARKVVLSFRPSVARRVAAAILKAAGPAPKKRVRK